MTLRRLLNQVVILFFACLCWAPLQAANPAPSDEPAAESVPPEAAAAPLAPADTLWTKIEANDPRLSRGTYAMYVGDVNRITQIPAQIGLIDGALYFMAPPKKGKNAVKAREQDFILPIATIKRVGLKKFGLNRQIHLESGYQRIVFVLSGAMFVNRRGTDALYDALVAAGVPTFEPERFIQGPPTAVIVVQ